MNNWRDYVDYQPRNPDASEDTPTSIVYLNCTLNEQLSNADTENRKISLSLVKEEIEDSAFIYDEANIGDAVERTLFEFDEWTDYPEVRDEQYEFIVVHRIRNRIAQETRRGFGETEFVLGNKQVVMYVGKSKSDAPIIVTEKDNKYAIFKHPNFKKYGFIMEKA